jgi:hypothetical protein
LSGVRPYPLRHAIDQVVVVELGHFRVARPEVDGFAVQQIQLGERAILGHRPLAEPLRDPAFVVDALFHPFLAELGQNRRQ